MKHSISVALIAGILCMAPTTNLVSQGAAPIIIDTGKAPNAKDPKPLIKKISGDATSLSNTVAKAIKSGSVEKTKGNELISSLTALHTSADGLYKGVAGGKNLMSMSGDVKKLLGHASKVDNLVGGIKGVKEINDQWNALEKQINALAPLAGL